MITKRLAKCIGGFLGCCLLAGALFVCLYFYDNKYTVPGETSQDGALLFPQSFETSTPVCAVNGWELYPDLLLMPDDLSAEAYTPLKIHVGQYLSLANLHSGGSPYGQATYRLRYRYDGAPMTCGILIPELFCAAEIYADGVLIAQTGTLVPYSPHVRDVFATFPLAGNGEIVVRTANYSHYYSGMTYPPLFAAPSVLSAQIAARLVFYSFWCFFSLAIALFSGAVWLGNRRRDALSLWFGLLSLSFAVRVFYPFVRQFGLPVVSALYALEDCAALFGICCALKIALTLTEKNHAGFARPLFSLSLGMTAAGALIPLFVLPALPAYTAAYALLISWYKLIFALGLMVLAGYGVARKTPDAPWLLGGVAAYGAGLCAGALLVGHFEPILGGWPEEYGAFFMVLCFAVLMVRRSRAMVVENQLLTTRLQEQVEQKTREVTGLLDERQRFLSEFLHDLKSPMSSVLTYARLVRENNILLDADADEKLRVMEEKCGDMTNRLRLMQDFTAENPLALQIEQLDLRAVCEEFCRMNRPDVEAAGPELRFVPKAPKGTLFVRGDQGKLWRLLQNLVYNAASFTPTDGCITLTVESRDGRALLTVADTGCGIAPEALPLLFDRFYTSRLAEGGRGLGLYIVKSIVAEHGGEITVRSEPGQGTAFTVFLPTAR